ncbi:MAG: electron transfer flavoprotein subunit beta/FixA family protein [Caldilineaceae bacterium]
MEIMVCVKRVPATGGKVTLTPDAQDIDTRYLGFTISPHEECAIEAALQLVEQQGGSTTVLTLGVPEAIEQLRDALAMGAERAILLETDGREWDAAATAAAIVDAVRGQAAAGNPFDLLLFGNEAADTGNYQVGIRVAHTLGWPCIAGIKALELQNGQMMAKREVKGGWEIYALPLPAVITVKEGINLPRYPSMQGRLRAKKKEILRMTPAWHGNALEKLRFKLPEQKRTQAEILGHGPEAAPKVIELLQRLGLVAP